MWNDWIFFWSCIGDVVLGKGFMVGKDVGLCFKNGFVIVVVFVFVVLLL